MIQAQKLLIKCGFIYTPDDVINLIENNDFLNEWCSNYYFHWTGYDSGIILFNRIIKMAEGILEIDLKLLNLLMEKCTNAASEYIYEILQTVPPNEETLKLFLKNHRIECPIGDKIFKKIIEYKIKPTNELLQIILTKGFIPCDFTINLIKTYNLDININVLYKKLDCSNDISKILIYFYEKEKIVTYNDIHN